METYKKNWVKYIIGFTVCLLVRLVPFRAPNLEPVLATQMPFAKSFGYLSAFSFGFLSIILYDIITSEVGIWTLITATTYGLLGLWATLYFKNRKNSSWNYAKFAVMGTLAYDAITGLSIGPLFFQQSFMVALIGQIPFTIIHLIGNISFALVLSPLIYRLVNSTQKSESKSFIKILNTKQA
ncbi:hypothetical protein K8Q96_00885 [Candidatus Nomurabacteria bacterium]|nr:hypothetical protein [Candidatus Nomurabacteria bacterium]